MIKIVKKKTGAGKTTYDMAQVLPEELVAGVIAAVGDTWTIDEAADFLLAEVVRQVIVEDVERPVSRYLPRHFEAETILGFAGVDISENIATDVVLVLEDRGLIERRHPGITPPPLEIILTSTGLQRGMALIGRFADNRVPASDRVVSLDHNDENLRNIDVELEVLRQRILRGNDVGDMTDAEREAAASEVYQLHLMLQDRQVRIAALIERSRGTLVWIADKAGGAAIGTMALAILQAICSYFGVL
ncbi:MAG TPA: hypothetical protein VK614_13400 [Allosphingosinicella sp.]|nr:hypothetical protein [Allosphingosinicella sp.]